MKVSFKTIDGARYWHATYGGGPEGSFLGRLYANRDQAFADEEFEPVRNPDTGRWGFKSNNGFWLSAQANGELWCNRKREDGWMPEAWESFELETHPDGSFSLKSDHGKYVCAEGGGGREMVADREAANAWECFIPSEQFWAGQVSGGGGFGLKPAVSGRLSVQEKFFVLPDGQTYRPVFASYLSALRREPSSWIDGLSEYARLGFNGVRVFAGALSWAGQTPRQACERLPQFLDIAGQLGLRVEVTAITDSGTGYDVVGHAKWIAQICAEHDNAILEIANEFWHPTQSPWVNDANNLKVLRGQLPSSIPVSLGAPNTDEPPLSGPFGEYLTLHLDRGRDKWNMVRRVRELSAAREEYKRPVLNNEPIGADEGEQPGRRLNDASIFFCMGALNRIFEVGGVFHSQAGLQAEPLGPVQRQCALAYIAGTLAIDTEDRLGFQNATWATSPVKSANFDQTIVRAYSGVAGNRGYLVLVGLRGDPRVEFQGGWRSEGVIAEVSGCQIVRLVR